MSVKFSLIGLKPKTIVTPRIFLFSPAAPWLEGYGYRKKISLSAGSAESGNNYQVKLLVGETSGASGEHFDLNNHAQNFGTDLRFTADDGDTELNFWRKEITGASPNQLAEMRVKVAADLTAPQDIYCYYGKAGDTDASSGLNTFPIFDDFSDGTLDAWTEVANIIPAPWNVTSQTLRNPSTVGEIHRCYHTAGHGLTSYALHVDFSTVGAASGQLIIFYKDADNSSTYRLTSYIDDQILRTESGDHTVDPATFDRWPQKWYQIRIEVLASGNIKTYYASDDPAPPGVLAETLVHNVNDTFTVAEGMIGVGDYATSSKFDNIRVRKLAATEPAFSSAGSEETP